MYTANPALPAWLRHGIDPVLDQAPDGIHILDQSGNLIYANNTFLRMLGRDPAEGLPAHVSEWEAQQKPVAELASLVAGKFTDERPFLTRHRRQDGSLYEAAISVARISHAGQTYLFCTVRDVSVQRQLEAALREREAQYRLLVADLKAVIFRTDAEGRWLFLNPAWTEVSGFAVESSLGQSFLAYVEPEDRQRCRDLFQALIERKQEYYRCEVRYRHRCGDVCWVELCARLTLDAQGTVTGTTGMLADITERKQVQDALRESEARFRTIFFEDHSVKLLIDPQTGRIVDANQASIDFYGYSYAQLTQMHIQAINQLSPEAIAYEMQKAAQRRKNFFNFQHRLASGELREVEVYSNTLTIKHQTYLLSFIHDVTEGKHAELALRTSEAQARRQVQMLEALSATLTAITSELDPERLLALIVERAAELLDVDAVELMTYDEACGDLVLAARFPLVPEHAGYRQGLGEGTLGHVARTRQSLILNDYAAWPGALPVTTTMGMVASLDVPLLQGERLVGVLGVGMMHQGRTFTSDDERLLLLFAQQATVALMNAQLNARLQIDSLTGLPNRGRFFELAEQTVREAYTHGRPGGAAILDIDHFKQVNDTYGHHVGDDVLRWIAAQCMALLPPEAVLGRIGGEEFAVILPGVDEVAAVAVLESVRQYIAVTPVPTRRGAISLTVSIGLTTLADLGGMIVDHLLEHADYALYQAKRSGRNQICAAATSAGVRAEALEVRVHDSDHEAH